LDGGWQVTQAFTTYDFTATGAITARNEPDRLADDINVKDYGAVGNGSTDDTAAIQLAFDAAFGPYATPNGQTNRFLNKPVFFPAGNYIITSELRIHGVFGGRIVGSGSGTTKITYSGSIAGTPTYTNLMYVNGMNSSTIEGISFVMTGGNAVADRTVSFNLNWDNAAPVNGSTVTFTDCAFSGATFGVLVGNDGYQCDMTTLINCKIDNCYRGAYSGNQNSMNNGIYGGSITNCFTGVYNNAGAFLTICGVAFAGQTDDSGASDAGDIAHATNYSTYISGCYSTSPAFAVLNAGQHYIAGCTHEPAGGTARAFVRIGSVSAAAVIESCSSTNGYLVGHPSALGFYIVDLQLDNPDWSHTPGFIREWYQAAPFTFATLPGTGNSAWWGTGLIFNITDCNTATWAATAAGGGSTKAAIRWNGTNWTVEGI
jgi:hypothetical protein